MSSLLPENYSDIFQIIKNRVNQARYQILKKVNKEMIDLYWDVGKTVSDQTSKGWGTGVVERLSKDLQIEYPEIKGFSPRNLRYMSNFYESYKDSEILQRLVAELPWGQNIDIFTKIKDNKEREFYLTQTAKNGWFRPDLQRRIKDKLYLQYQDSQNNFQKTIDPVRVSEVEWEFRDQYSLDLLELTDNHKENELELAMVKNISKIINEFGIDFAFMGRQFRVEHDDKDYYIDLLFYHRKLKSLIAVELKAVEFKPEHSQQLNWYLHLLDKKVKYEDDNPTIGILLCKSKSKLTVEYALELVNHPMGVATYTYSELPEEIAKFLPNLQQLQDALDSDNLKLV